MAQVSNNKKLVKDRESYRHGEIENSKRIAKNTLLLYFRMILVMGVGLYTSRVVLDKLGVVDYGLFNTVAGVVAMLAFLNGTLSTSSSRFLTYALGVGNKEKVSCTFSTAFYSHLLLALLVVFLMETGGLWFVHNKLVIPPERMVATLWVFHISIFTTFISITQVPYTSVIIAHENMNVYAYLGIFEAIAKLVIVYLLTLSTIDKLITYSILIGFVQLLVALFYKIYCRKKYIESVLKFEYDYAILRQMLSFSGQGLIAEMANIFSLQGIIVLINLFFSPAIVASQAIGNQISNAIMQFVKNMQTAVTPQIIKLYAIGDYENFRKLTLNSSIYVHELLLFLALPSIVVMEPLLNLWLVKVPSYAIVFAQLILIKQILNVYGMTLYIPMVAAGKLKSNSLASIWMGIGIFGFLYVLLKLGYGVMWVQYICIIQTIIYSYIIKPYILCKEVGFTWNEILFNFFKCAKISVFPIIIATFFSLFVDVSSFSYMLFAIISIGGSVCITAYLSLDKETRLKFRHIILLKLRYVLKFG